MTIQVKHTPGPWKLVIENRTAPTIEAKGGYIACTITYGTPSNKNNWDIANARLIAAAPELLEACTLMQAWFESHYTDLMGVDKHFNKNVILKKAKQAIEKAVAGRVKATL